MTALELARLQFGITTLFHFIFVPMSIGLVWWVAYCQTRWYRTRDETYLRMTRFWGKLMLVSLAIGVVTGIVQEFQFGMNWSQYSRYVGDIFGAPLAMEGLATFFLESTFLGLWLFGWGRLSPKVHLVSIWLLAIGTVMSAFFILAANSWMQHPVGYVLNEATGRAEMTSIFAVLTNSTLLYAFPHTVLGAITTGGMVVLGVSAWQLLRERRSASGGGDAVWARSAKQVLPIVLVAALGTALAGHFQGMLLEKQQPMKMAAAEAQFETEKPAAFSLFATGDLEHNPGHTNVDIRIPYALSFLATGSFTGEVKGINQIQAEEEQKYGPGEYAPVVGVTYWSFRAMVGAGSLMILFTLIGVVLARRKRLTRTSWFLKLALPFVLLPPIANLSGWVFTEMGRQPWVVYGLLRTDDANSPLVSSASLWITLIGYTLLYGVLAGVGGWIAAKEIRHGAEPPESQRPDDAPPVRPDLALTY
ncbi:cytochrome ubiquinol oxidase subunit I [Conexibacter sp. JD483]|uniref:cytochrome ubiquinol oxidase subunit I n=1 Tax=unclassified Conexibacter TaxID=2627773 RepID=UPI00271C41B1|nr:MULTISPECIES: cytochrome ubiquinol oxidase subunit I [unclassified Conexibacter]MDO8186956.1 cytochrome ubiquinol oxidase subunit I [Conexibacter sp. CPCC 205706]MDO8200589.1 cytochrome ubiquinol oxidase subunit I [Conexibacter sp. CPCC 205762]MDR9368833.1 cytochrome ubiquinol oxidase subunit I [Conexibacter sp. JD483]